MTESDRTGFNQKSLTVKAGIAQRYPRGDGDDSYLRNRNRQRSLDFIRNALRVCGPRCNAWSGPMYRRVHCQHSRRKWRSVSKSELGALSNLKKAPRNFAILPPSLVDHLLVNTNLWNSRFLRTITRVSNYIQFEYRRCERQSWSRLARRPDQATQVAMKQLLLLTNFNMVPPGMCWLRVLPLLAHAANSRITVDCIPVSITGMVQP